MGSIGQPLTPSPGAGFSWLEHFLSNAITGNNVLNVGTSNGATPVLGGSAGHPGTITLDTSTHAASRSWISMGTTDVLVPGGGIAYYCEWLFNLTTLSTASEEYTFRVGIHDAVSGSAVTDGVWFEYLRTTGVNWLLITENGGTQTTPVDSGVAVAAGAWLKLGISINGAGTSASFIINGVNVGTIATNIPTTNGSSPCMQIIKTNGTTARTVQADYVWLKGAPA